MYLDLKMKMHLIEESREHAAPYSVQCRQGDDAITQNSHGLLKKETSFRSLRGAGLFLT